MSNSQDENIKTDIDIDETDLVGFQRERKIKLLNADEMIRFLATSHLTYHNVDKLAAYFPRTDMGCFYYDKNEHPFFHQIRQMHESIHAASVPRTTIGLSGWYTNFGMVNLFANLIKEAREKQDTLLLPLTANLFRHNLRDSLRNKIIEISFHDEVCDSNFKALENINEGFTLYLCLHLAREASEHTNAKGLYPALMNLVDYSFLNHRIPFDIFLTFEEFGKLDKKLGIEVVEPVYVNATCIPLREISPSIVLFDPEFNPYFRLHKMRTELEKEVIGNEKDGYKIASAIATHFGWPDPKDTFWSIADGLLFALKNLGMGNIISTLFDAHFGPPPAPRQPTIVCIQNPKKIRVSYHRLVIERGLETEFANYYGFSAFIRDALRNNIVRCPFYIMECFKGDKDCTICQGKKWSTIGDKDCWLRTSLEGIKLEATNEIAFVPPRKLKRKKKGTEKHTNY